MRTEITTGKAPTAAAWLATIAATSDVLLITAIRSDTTAGANTVEIDLQHPDGTTTTLQLTA